LEHFGLPFSKQSLIPVQPGFEGAYKDMLSYLKEKKDLPQAFFCFNDVAAFGVIKALKDCGYKVPQDVSIIGFDDLPMSLMMEPRLTSVRVPTQLIGSLAARSLVEMLGPKTIHSSKGVLVHGKLVIRDSVIDRK
jgi:LacI family transcriptional regulator